jgi:RNA polymerase sigma-70 factor (sigma-E family)
VRSGADDVGFEAFVQARTGALLRTAYLLTGDQGLAEDLLQTTLVKVAAHWSRLIPGRDPEPYVRTALYRESISAWRRRRVVEVSFDREPADRGVASHDEAVAVRLSVARALDQLGPRQRACIVLRFFDDLSESATAETLGCSIGTVRSQTFKALKRLRDMNPGLLEEVAP